MVAIVLTGEIGAGKSTVLSWFAAQGDRVLDADAIVSDLWQRTDVLSQAVELWGADIVAGGQLNRRLLAERAFTSETSQKQLCDLLHPLVRLEMERCLPTLGLVVAEIPLVFESGRPWWAEGILFLKASLKARSRRNENRGLHETELLRRERYFMDSAARAKASDWIIDNDGSVEELYQQLSELRRQLLHLDSLLELRWRSSSDQVCLLDRLVKQKLLVGLSVIQGGKSTDNLDCRGWTQAKLLSYIPELQELAISKSFVMKVGQRRQLLEALQSH